MTEKIPLILQTDIGGDIDDFWALVMILKQPQFDLQYILTDTDNTVYRAAICAKLLEKAGRTDVEIGAGLVEWPESHVRTHLPWVESYEMKNYPNFTRYGVERFIERVKASPVPVTLVAIGPAPSLAEALRRAPEIAGKINFIGMFGSVYFQHYGKAGRIAEYNVKRDVKAAQAVFEADWLSATIIPLDTCGRIVLDGENYSRIAKSDDPLVKTIVEVYEIWLGVCAGAPIKEHPLKSSILFDTGAVHLASSREFMRMERMDFHVDDEGMLQEGGKPFDVAIEWTDLEGYDKFLVDTLVGE